MKKSEFYIFAKSKHMPELVVGRIGKIIKNGKEIHIGVDRRPTSWCITELTSGLSIGNVTHLNAAGAPDIPNYLFDKIIEAMSTDRVQNVIKEFHNKIVEKDGALPEYLEEIINLKPNKNYSKEK